ncbi:MAG: GNAT family N-acetyltransferase [Crocinitomix sp.]|nr:GNAT family N-acetyltransferase [Crocinitomix sp.]
MIRGVFDEYGAKTKGTVYTDPTTDALFKLFQVDNAVLFVAEEKGLIKGCCGIYPTADLPNGCAELVKFYVAGDVRGTGVGRKLYEKCEAFAFENSYDNLYIESTPDFKDAVRIYEKIGYKMLTTALGDSGHFGCDIWMLKRLNTDNS